MKLSNSQLKDTVINTYIQYSFIFVSLVVISLINLTNQNKNRLTITNHNAKN